jgi:hypothetical protein
MRSPSTSPRGGDARGHMFDAMNTGHPKPVASRQLLMFSLLNADPCFRALPAWRTPEGDGSRGQGLA